MLKEDKKPCRRKHTPAPMRRARRLGSELRLNARGADSGTYAQMDADAHTMFAQGLPILQQWQFAREDAMRIHRQNCESGRLPHGPTVDFANNPFNMFYMFQV